MKKRENSLGSSFFNYGNTLAILQTVAGGRKKAFAKVARYMLDNPDAVMNLNISALAEKTGASKATISRFSKYLGYRNYRNFQLSMASSLVKESPVSDIFLQDDAPETVIRRVFELNRKSLNDTESLTDMKVFTDVARRIVKARRVIFFGVGSSGIAGRLGAVRFEGLGIPTTGATDPYEGLFLLYSADKKDVVIFISHSGRSTLTLDLLRIARRRGAYTVALTNYSDSELAKLADTVILTVFLERRVNAAVSHSGTAQICVIDVLYFLAAHFQGSSFENMAEQVEQDAERLLRSKPGKKMEEKDV